MNSREKGKRGERAWRDELRAQGFEARRGQQFSGSPESPDVICPALPWIHFEVKCVERLSIEDAMAQARRDARTPHPGPLPRAEREKIPVVAHKRNFCGWLVTMDAETFFKFLRGDFCEPQKSTKDTEGFLATEAKEATEEKILGMSREARGRTAEAAVVPEKTETTNINKNCGHRPHATEKEQNV